MQATTFKQVAMAKEDGLYLGVAADKRNSRASQVAVAVRF
jgi:hypothetical protein